MPMPLNEEGLIDRVSIRHSVSPDAVRTILRALRSSGGSMAQFSHPDFGGMSQWSHGMTMVGDMFNDGLKSKLDAVCTELAAYVVQSASTDRSRSRDDPEVSYRAARRGSGYTSLKIGWSDLNNVQEAGQYPFRDGMITVLELEIAIWRKHPNALFTLMRKNPIRQGVEYVLGTPEFSSEN